MDQILATMPTETMMTEIGVRARAASRLLAMATTDQKRRALDFMAEAISANSEPILMANFFDCCAARKSGLSSALVDRLLLTPQRIASIAASVQEIAGLDDPVGTIITSWERPNGLKIERVRTPLGVIGVIYESRPNVTADAGALCVMAGNAVILRGGSDSIYSSAAIHACLVAGLKAAGLSEDGIQLVPTTNRAAVGEMLKGLSGNLDVVVPRGGRSLVERVQAEARVPVFAHLEGLCHLYIDKSADITMAVSIALNAKMRRTGVCGATETLLVDMAAVASHLIPVLSALHDTGCAIVGDETVCRLFSKATPARAEDWATEYLDAIISVRVVDGVGGAIRHIDHWSSHHTEAIVAEDMSAVRRFFAEVDSAILLHNASTQFADGGEFGLGGEIGIATGRIHARGPVGCEQLTSFKYCVHGTGQIRP